MRPSENSNEEIRVNTLFNKERDRFKRKKRKSLDEMIEDFNRQVPTKKKVNKRRNNK